VLVELDLHRSVRVEGGQAGATVMEEEWLEVIERALEDDGVNMLAIEIGVGARLGLVA
jgi:hypothetical protein